MEKVLFLSVAITILFSIFKFVEMKFIDKQMKPFKIIFREVVVVFIASLVVGFFFVTYDKSISDFFNVITDTKVISTATTEVFTDTPGF